MLKKILVCLCVFPLLIKASTQAENDVKYLEELIKWKLYNQDYKATIELRWLADLAKIEMEEAHDTQPMVIPKLSKLCGEFSELSKNKDNKSISNLIESEYRLLQSGDKNKQYQAISALDKFLPIEVAVSLANEGWLDDKKTLVQAHLGLGLKSRSKAANQRIFPLQKDQNTTFRFFKRHDNKPVPDYGWFIINQFYFSPKSIVIKKEVKTHFAQALTGGDIKLTKRTSLVQISSCYALGVGTFGICPFILKYQMAKGIFDVKSANAVFEKQGRLETTPTECFRATMQSILENRDTAKELLDEISKSLGFTKMHNYRLLESLDANNLVNNAKFNSWPEMMFMFISGVSMDFKNFQPKELQMIFSMSEDDLGVFITALEDIGKNNCSDTVKEEWISLQFRLPYLNLAKLFNLQNNQPRIMNSNIQDHHDELSTFSLNNNFPIFQSDNDDSSFFLQLESNSLFNNDHEPLQFEEEGNSDTLSLSLFEKKLNKSYAREVAINNEETKKLIAILPDDMDISATRGMVYDALINMPCYVWDKKDKKGQADKHFQQFITLLVLSVQVKDKNTQQRLVEYLGKGEYCLVGLNNFTFSHGIEPSLANLRDNHQLYKDTLKTMIKPSSKITNELGSRITVHAALHGKADTTKPYRVRYLQTLLYFYTKNPKHIASSGILQLEMEIEKSPYWNTPYLSEAIDLWVKDPSVNRRFIESFCYYNWVEKKNPMLPLNFGKLLAISQAYSNTQALQGESAEDMLKKGLYGYFDIIRKPLSNTNVALYSSSLTSFFAKLEPLNIASAILSAFDKEGLKLDHFNLIAIHTASDNLPLPVSFLWHLLNTHLSRNLFKWEEYFKSLDIDRSQVEKPNKKLILNSIKKADPKTSEEFLKVFDESARVY